MRSLKKVCSILGIVFISMLMNFVYVKPIQAQVPEMHIKLEVKRAGTSWYNYNGTEPSEGEILPANPGDKVTVRVKIWNTGVAAQGLVGSAVLHDTLQYVGSITNINLDADGHGDSFVGEFFDLGGFATIAQVDAGSSENAGYESMTADFTLIDDFPAGETYVDAAAGVTAFGLQGGEPQKTPTFNPPFSYLKTLFSVDKAYANGYEQYSGVRISVNGGLPDTGADLR